MLAHGSHALFILACLSSFLMISLTSPTPNDNYTGGDAAYVAADLILFNCGANSTLRDTSNRSWEADDQSQLGRQYDDGRVLTEESTANSSSMHPVFPVPYQTVRLFYSRYTYYFRLNHMGHKFIRLHFYPVTNYAGGHTTSQSVFNVTANAYTLLNNFNASLDYDTSASQPSFMKEFVIYVDGQQMIGLTFDPYPQSFAFINGIEIVSVPDGLYPHDRLIKYLPDRLFALKNDMALEMMYRLNVGGGIDVPKEEDSGTHGMFRYWIQDDPYIYGADFGFTPHDESRVISYTNETPPYSAPKIVYRTSRTMGNTSTSLEWAFPVDSGFNYLLRFHFCEIQLEITNQNQRVFTITIDNQTAETDVDVIFWTGGSGIPIFRDYIARVPDDGRRGKKDMRLSLFPSKESLPQYDNALLNGLEIFKLHGDDQSFATPNINPPQPESPPGPGEGKKGPPSIVYAVVGSVIGVLAVIAAVIFLIFRRQRKVKDVTGSKSSWMTLHISSRSAARSNGSGTPIHSNSCRQFFLREIIAATGNFDDSFIIGRGGYGNVYKGLIDNGSTVVAIKRQNASSKQGIREFLTEIQLLSKLRYVHLVSLMGYCDEQGEMILVYDYMSRGTLRDHLYNSENPPLMWKQRLQICLGAAKGLDYLHTGVKDGVIHRDVKSTNILLDEKWVAKMSDFGISKVGPVDGASTHVTTEVKGSFGYVDPEYYRRQQLTDKSDVYSFGVVLFEVLCARPAILPDSPREEVNLAEWGRACCRKGTVSQIIDPNLDGQIAPECLNKFVETAIACLKGNGIKRPAMSDVVRSLELAIQLQEVAEGGGGTADGGDSLNSENGLIRDANMVLGDVEMHPIGTTEAVLYSSKYSGIQSVEVFSEIVSPEGR